MLTQRAPFCIGAMAKKGTLSQHFVPGVQPLKNSKLATTRFVTFKSVGVPSPHDHATFLVSDLHPHPRPLP